MAKTCLHKCLFIIIAIEAEGAFWNKLLYYPHIVLYIQNIGRHRWHVWLAEGGGGRTRRHGDTRPDRQR